ncbi:MAG TPA: pyridoxamine 5'-phosphate oxidase family protein [Mycobacteriales bacterium]
MGKVYDEIEPKLATWLEAQPVFFVATAPLAADGLVNCSPKGLSGTFTVLGPRRVAYLDLTGSGVETVAHLRENGRIVLMFCAFDGRPQVVRLHGRGTVLSPDDPQFAALRPRFSDHRGARAIVTVDVTRIGDSCGYGVPLMDVTAERDVLDLWSEKKGDDGLAEYWTTRNAASLDGLPGLPIGR